MDDEFSLEDPDKLAVFVQEYVRHEGQDDAGILAVIKANLRNPMWAPTTIAERILSKPEIQAAIKSVKVFYKPEALKEVSQDTISADMEDLYQQCVNDRQYNAAISAKKLQAEMHGFMKTEVNLNVKHSVSNLPDSALEKIARTAVVDAEFTEVKPGKVGLPSVPSKPV